MQILCISCEAKCLYMLQNIEYLPDFFLWSFLLVEFQPILESICIFLTIYIHVVHVNIVKRAQYTYGNTQYTLGNSQYAFPKGYTKYLYGSEQELVLVLGEGLLRKPNIQAVVHVYGGTVSSF